LLTYEGALLKANFLDIREYLAMKLNFIFKNSKRLELLDEGVCLHPDLSFDKKACEEKKRDD